MSDVYSFLSARHWFGLNIVHIVLRVLLLLLILLCQVLPYPRVRFVRLWLVETPNTILLQSPQTHATCHLLTEGYKPSAGAVKGPRSGLLF